MAEDWWGSWQRQGAIKTRSRSNQYLRKPKSSTRYTVKRGDTLWGIAKKNNMSLNALLKLNPKYKKNPDLIYRGAKIKIK